MNKSWIILFVVDANEYKIHTLSFEYKIFAIYVDFNSRRCLVTAERGFSQWCERKFPLSTERIFWFLVSSFHFSTYHFNRILKLSDTILFTIARLCDRSAFTLVLCGIITNFWTFQVWFENPKTDELNKCWKTREF